MDVVDFGDSSAAADEKPPIPTVATVPATVACLKNSRRLAFIARNPVVMIILDEEDCPIDRQFRTVGPERRVPGTELLSMSGMAMRSATTLHWFQQSCVAALP